MAENPDRGISGFRITGQSLINENCHNSRISNDIVMKLGSITKLCKRNTVTSKEFDDDFMLLKCDIIIFFPIYGQFGAIPKPDFGRMVYKTYIVINRIDLSYKSSKQN